MTPPTLTPEIVADEAAAAARIDQRLGPDSRYRQHVRAILRAQDALRRVLADREWQVYLDLEIVTNVRFASALFMVTRWAFEQGQRNAIPRGP